MNKQGSKAGAAEAGSATGAREAREAREAHEAGQFDWCPACGVVMKCERRGGDFFAWCAGTGDRWGMGCYGQSAFGPTREQAIALVRERFFDKL